MRTTRLQTDRHPGNRCLNRHRVPVGPILAVLAVLAGSALVGCTDDDSTDAGEPDGDATSGLRTLGDRDAFVGAVRAALVAQRGDDEASGGQDADAPGGAPPAPTVPVAEADGGEAQRAPAADDVTGTNVQEAGVDERDRVKSDGRRLYVLDVDDGYGGDGPGGGGVPVPEPVPEPEPEPEPEPGPEPGPVDEPSATDPIGVPPPPPAARNTLRILDMDRETPDARPLIDLEIDLDGRRADGFYLYGDDAQRFAVLSAAGNGYWDSWGEPLAFRGSDSLVARIDVTDPDTAAVDARLRIDGQTVASRRIGRYLFLATRFYPTLSGVSPFAVDARTWRQTVASASEEALLPGWSLDGGETRPLIDPGECFVAAASDAPGGYSPDIVTLSLIDLSTLTPIDNVCYLGASETLYASPDSVYLATTRWDYSPGVAEVDGMPASVSDDAIVRDDVFFQDPRVDTDLHRFDIGEGSLSYVGSGSVRGHLGWNPQRKPYRMSARDGRLRIATLAARQGPDVSPVIVTVLEADGAGGLRRVAELPNEARPAPIGKPGEQLYASRFVGDRAYLVTFRQTDPLYVVDLSAPTDPQVLGELQIEGYSDWLQPIGERHLLGIGKDAVAVPDAGDGRGGLVQGVKLSLFDVSDPRAPREVQSLRIGQRGTDSVALQDARGITVQPATEQRSARVALGIDVHGQATPDGLPSGPQASVWYPWSYSALHGFEVRTGADAGLTLRGVLVAASASGDGEQRWRPYGQDRSVIAGDAVFYVHDDRVRVARWGEFDNATPAR